ncbi:hypothetical protein M3Y99_00039700 [Aphelenchoides fujianensis]|nr:hypothetical protein M3Y99_00039700 [Aphelenchoides fujianensis]
MRCVLKVLEFFVSVYLVYAMWRIGPYFVLLVASLAIPPYGLYLATTRSVDPDPTHLHSVPYLKYKLLARARSWQRADASISLSMSVICCGFSAVLFFGYFKVRSATPYFLYAAVASMLLAFLYTFDALIAVCQLKAGSVDFAKSDSFSRPFAIGNRAKPSNQTQAEYASSYFAASDPTARPNLGQNEHPVPIYLPSLSSSNVPTILQRLRSEIEAENRKPPAGHSEVPPAGWPAGHERPLVWTEARSGPITLDLGIKTEEGTRSFDLRIWDQRPNASSRAPQIGKISQQVSLETDEELPPPPPPALQKPAVAYKKASVPYARRAVVPTDPVTSNRNSATTGTSDEDLAGGQRGAKVVGIHEPQLSPLVFYRTAPAQAHPPAHKARLVMIEDDGDLRRERPQNTRTAETSHGSSEGSTARLEEIERPRLAVQRNLRREL